VAFFSKVARCLFIDLNKIFDFQATICYCLSCFFVGKTWKMCLCSHVFLLSSCAIEELVIEWLGLDMGYVNHDTHFLAEEDCKEKAACIRGKLYLSSSCQL